MSLLGVIRDRLFPQWTPPPPRVVREEKFPFYERVPLTHLAPLRVTRVLQGVRGGLDSGAIARGAGVSERHVAEVLAYCRRRGMVSGPPTGSGRFTLTKVGQKALHGH